MSHDTLADEIKGDVKFPETWVVFAPVEGDAPLPPAETLKVVPEKMPLGSETLTPEIVRPFRCQSDLRPLFGEPFQEGVAGKVAYVFLRIEADKAGEATLGFGGDYRLQAWLNGEPILGESDGPSWPPSIKDLLVTAKVREGVNILAVRFVSGKGSSLLALGGPRELRAGDFRSVHSEPLFYDPRWTREGLAAQPGEKGPVEIGSRRELFIDDFMIDAMTGAAERRMHHPVPQGAAFRPDKPWEGPTAGYYTVIPEETGFRLYYSGRPAYRITPAGEHIQEKGHKDESRNQVTCMAESADGAWFDRPSLGLFEFQGSKDNNIVWKGTPSHNFSPFKDPNPDTPADQRYKAIAYHVNGGGLGAFGSPDGVHWRALSDKRIIEAGRMAVELGTSGFDSHNLAFYDTLRGRYVAYFRLNTGGLRRIATCESEDFLDWTEAEFIEYEDDRDEHMYTNNIRPYFRAPHIYIGMPARFVPRRKKVPAHPVSGVSDGLLMCSRDGKRFHRWEEGFVRGGAEPEVWTDRNNYPAWGLIQTGPDELSMYWTEHNRHPTKRLRRGTLRVDGFVSIHAGGDVGEMLTRPFVFSGGALEVNYATSAIGTVRFEMCDESGAAIEGFALGDSEVLYGNETAHTVVWHGGRALRELAGRPVRMRVRLHDADVFSFRFCE